MPRRAAPLLSLSLLAITACSGAHDDVVAAPPPCPSAAPSAPAGAAAKPSPAPASVATAEGAVTRLASRDDVPLTGPRVDGKAGDWMVANSTAAVVVTQEGRIADYGLAGSRDEITWLNPTIAVGLANQDAPVLEIAAEPGNKALRLKRAVGAKPLVLITWIYLKGAALHLETVAECTGDDPALAVTLGERVGWGNVPTWMDGVGFVKTAAKVSGGFLARDALGTAYALCSENGPLFARIDEQEYAGLFETAQTGESVVLVPARGRSPVRSIVVTASTTSLGDAVMALPCGPKGPRTKLTIPPIAVPRASLQLVRCAEGDKPDRPFVNHRSAADATGPVKTWKLGPVELPEGCFRARLVAPGHAAGPWTEPSKLAGDKVPPELLPRAGTLAFSVTEGGKPLPARLVVRGEPGSGDPDWGDDAGGTGVASNVIASETGSGEVPIPAGKYRVSITRGFEYSAHEQTITVQAGKPTKVTATLDRVVDTKGWVAADLHLHAVPSSDAPSLLTDRVRSLVAAGIEVAVATDHNAVTDYRPAIADLGMKERIFSVIGDEITTRDTPFGHFNAFPLDPKTAPITFKGTTPKAIFAAARSSQPYGKDTIVQVNHPRMGGIGYFELLRFDREDIPGWLARSPLADLGFDSLEVFNGDHYTRITKVEECLSDWYALLNAGHRFTATGNSDSHRVSFHEPGTPRNLVLVPDDDPSKVDERAFVDAVRKGRVVVSSGPFVTLQIGDGSVGDTVPAGEAEITATVDAPPWVDLDEVYLVKRGNVLETWKTDKKKDKRPWVFKTKKPLKKDDWVIAIARGRKAMTFLYRVGAFPFGFTNPIFVK